MIYPKPVQNVSQAPERIARLAQMELFTSPLSQKAPYEKIALATLHAMHRLEKIKKEAL